MHKATEEKDCNGRQGTEASARMIPANNPGGQRWPGTGVLLLAQSSWEGRESVGDERAGHMLHKNRAKMAVIGWPVQMLAEQYGHSKKPPKMRATKHCAQPWSLHILCPNMLSCLPSTSSLFVCPRPAKQASGRVRFPLGYDYYPFTSISSSPCPTGHG
jgi:hypothetical protein